MAHQFHRGTLREYDVRGVADETLTVADARALGRSFGTVVQRAGGRHVCIGRDGRESSPRLAAAAIDGLLAAGCDVRDIGLGPTPMLYFSVFDARADAGLMVTGSHNPRAWNGFKLMLKDRPLHGADIAALGVMAAAGDWASGAGDARGHAIIDRYVEALARDFRGHPMTIAWDCGNGAAGPVVERLTRVLPGTHHLLFSDVDGRFPNHHPDPAVEANLADLKAAVAAHGCDFGVAFDGDADRIGVVDGRGRVVWGDQLLGILAEPVLRAVPGACVIADVKCSQALFDRIAALGGRPLMWKTGHSLIKARMQAEACPIAGEMSGHMFFAHRWHGVDDGLLAAVRLIEAVTLLGGSLTALKDAMPALASTPELQFACADSRKFAVVADVRARLRSSGAAVNDIDGVRVTGDDGWWLLRASNTGPQLTARAEARNEAALQQLLAELHRQLALAGVDTVAATA